MKNNKTISIVKRVFVLFSLFSFLLAESQELQNYIQEAEANNPKIEAYNVRHNIAEAEVGNKDTQTSENGRTWLLPTSRCRQSGSHHEAAYSQT